MRLLTFVIRTAPSVLVGTHQSAYAQFGFSGGPDRSLEFAAFPWVIPLALAVGISCIGQARRRNAYAAIKLTLVIYAVLEAMLVASGVTLCVGFGRESNACLAPVLFAFMGFMFSGLVLLGLLPLVALTQAIFRGHRSRHQGNLVSEGRHV